MLRKIAIIGTLLAGVLSASPIQITLNLSSGLFDSGVTTPGIDTGTGFVTSGAACTGGGCLTLTSLLPNLNGATFAFTVPSGSATGAGSVLTGTLTQAQRISGLAFTGQSAFNQNASITENISASGVVGFTVPLTGTMVLNWSGNSTTQTRSATGTITLSGDLVASVPEPSTVSMLLAAAGLLIGMRLRLARGQA